jgi:hypothetical protein
MKTFSNNIKKLTLNDVYLSKSMEATEITETQVIESIILDENRYVIAIYHRVEPYPENKQSAGQALVIDNYGQGWTSIGSMRDGEKSFYSFTKILVEGVEYTEPLPESCILLVKSLVNNYLSKNVKNVTNRANFGAEPSVDYTFFTGLAAIQKVAKEINSYKNQSILKFSETNRVDSLRNAFDSGC